ncbi:MAG: HipA domain-containing protein [Kiritimatiellia bacterium]
MYKPVRAIEVRVWGHQVGAVALEEAFRRMAFNVMAANCDDHSKNISFLLREGKGWTLAPAYDVTHAHNPAGEWTKPWQPGRNLLSRPVCPVRK